MQKLLAVLVILAIPTFYFLYMYQPDMVSFPTEEETGEPIVHIGNVPIRVEVANTDSARAKGLGGRDSLGATNGMLFIFDKSDYYQIWMKDMKIPIDVIWIDESLTVVDITRNLRPETFPQTFEPRSPVRFVIETNFNYAESFGIDIGDKVTLPKSLIPEDLKEIVP